MASSHAGPGEQRTPVRRATARVMPVSPSGEVLLLCDQDPGRPGDLRWGTIGGEVDAGETHQQAAVRELFEEIGLRVGPERLTAAFHRDEREFSYDGRLYLGDSTFFGLGLPRDVEVSFEHLEEAEVGNVFEARWWTPEEVRADGRLVAPDLPEIMTLAIAAVAQHERNHA
jgi:8-oxo-dGTP pyrophosphatase MutT (NUDIX family)